MRKNLSLLAGILALAILFVFYENYMARKQVEEGWEFWANAIDSARQENLTTEGFYSRYGNLGDEVSDEIYPSPALVQRVKLSGISCSEYSFRISYSKAEDDSASSSFLSGRGQGVWCFI